MKTENPYIIFLVEDDQVFAKTLELHLKEHIKFKVNIYTFPNGEACIKNLYLKPAIIILDYFLDNQNPKAENGLEVLKKIKINDPEIKVIMLSAQDKIDVAVGSMLHGAYNYITKTEVAFLRVQNSINNIIKLILLKKELKSAKKGKTIVLIIIGILIVITLYLGLNYPEILNR